MLAVRLDGDLTRLAPRYSARSIEQAQTALAQAKVLRRLPQLLEVDLFGDEEVFDDPSAEALAVNTPLGEPRLEAWLTRAAQRGIPARVCWFSERKIVIVFDDGKTGPCAACAMRYDRGGRHLHPNALEGVGVVATSGAEPLQLMRSLLRSFSFEQRGQPAQAYLFDTETFESHFEPFAPHPSCECSGSRERTQAPPPIDGWPQAAEKHFTPLVCLEDEPHGQAPLARVVFRRARWPWARRAADYGVASASGKDAKLRAFAEGVERFSMLHAPPELRDCTPSNLPVPAFDASVVNGWLFREADRRPGFRFPRFDETSAGDWCVATRALSGEQRAVPASLVGRPHTSGLRLADLTSSGYAAHTDPHAAAVNAALELLERDAVLSWWYAQLPLRRVAHRENTAFGLETRAFWMTLDVAVPVVMLVARLPTGGMLLTSAAALSLDEAWSKASSELEAAVWTWRRNSGRPPPAQLDDVAAAHGPIDHLDFYLQPSNAGPVLEQMFSSSLAHSPEAVTRAPAVGSRTQLAMLNAALERAGLELWLVQRSLPRVFGPRWHVVRALIPGIVEASWGQAYRRLASSRLSRLLETGPGLNPLPHPLA